MGNESKECCRKNSVGGQAVIEGVMMKNGERVALAVRKDDGTIEIKNSKFVAQKTKHKWLNIPILRGVIGFVESMILSFKTLGASTDMLGLEEEDERIKAEKKAKKEAKKRAKEQKQGKVVNEPQEEKAEEKAEENQREKPDNKPEKKESGATTVIVMVISLILGLGLAVFLFTFLPSLIANYVGKLFKTENFFVRATVEGVVKILIFIAYLLLVSLMKDIKRTFQYHGAEHKSIACYESGMELTPENARKCTRFHPRCGTSFLFVMLIIGILVGMLIPFWGEKLWLRNIIKLLTLPLIMGIGYEFIMFAGKHNNWFTRMLSAPGLWMQRITTREPDDYQLAIAICAIKATMPEEFPDFDPSEYFITREQNKGHIAYTEQKLSAIDNNEPTQNTELKEDANTTSDSQGTQGQEEPTSYEDTNPQE